MEQHLKNHIKENQIVEKHKEADFLEIIIEGHRNKLSKKGGFLG